MISNRSPAKAVPIRNYLSILNQLSARTTLHVELPQRPAGRPNLIDSESSNDGVMLTACEEKLGNPVHAKHYIDPYWYHDNHL